MLFDPHIHMTSRTTADYEAMAAAGIAVIVEPAFWLGQPRTHVGTFEDASLVPHPVFSGHAEGYLQAGLIGPQTGSVHTGLSVAQLRSDYEFYIRHFGVAVED